MGWRDVIILEKGELTSGSTWHAAGLVGQLRSHRNITRMLQYSVGLYKTLEAETGLTTGWKESGCLHLASTKERILELKKGATTARSFGLDLHMITQEEALKLCPILNMEGIIGAAYMPSDGQADPSGLTMALAKATRCCWPPDSWAGYWSILSLNPTMPSISTTLLSISGLGIFFSFKP